jgi:hypothetical protein
MPSIKIDEELKEFINYGKAQDGDEYVIVEASDWVNQYKDYDIKEVVLLHKASGKHYAYYDSRSGSYYSDYEYDSPEELIEVEPIEVKRIEYKVVK